MAEQIVRKRTYIVTWAILMCLTGLTGGVSFINMGQWSPVVAFLIAAVKAGLVGAFFMHLLYEKETMVRVWAMVGVFWLGILFVLTMGDYITRGFIRVPGK